MTVSEWIAAVKDALIVLGVGFVVWWVYHAGGNSVKVVDAKEYAQQIEQNQKTVDSWKAAADKAEATHEQTLASISAAVNSDHHPLFMCRPTAPSPVSGHPASTGTGQANSPAHAADTGPGKDIRPLINAFELKYAAALADCHKDLQSWPTER